MYCICLFFFYVDENIAVDLAVWAATVSVSVFILLSIVLVIIVTVIAVLCKRRMSRYFAIGRLSSKLRWICRMFKLHKELVHYDIV